MSAITKYYDVVVKTGTDGLTHVPKAGIPAAEVIILKSIHGSEMVTKIKEIKPKLKIMEKRDEKGKVTKQEVELDGKFLSIMEVRDYLSQVYTERRVMALFGDPLSGRVLPSDLSGGASVDRFADQVKARVDGSATEGGASLK